MPTIDTNNPSTLSPDSEFPATRAVAKPTVTNSLASPATESVNDPEYPTRRNSLNVSMKARNEFPKM